MEVVRAVRFEDLQGLYELTRQATYGLTTLQLNQEQLLERVELSHFAFHRQSQRGGGEPYLLVMEDLESGQLVGSAAVFAKTGGYQPFYSYRRVREPHRCPSLGIDREIESLHLQRIHDGPSEIGSLFLLPAFRGGGRGRLLSLSRFALLAQRPERFASSVIAEMRGICDADGISPFWEAIGRPFIGLDFPAADSLSTMSKEFIDQLMPRYPIYTDLLPASARAVLSQVHPETRPAVELLRGEGFHPTDCIDIFDGGPVLECATESIGAVRRCRAAPVAAVVEKVEGAAQIVATTHSGFCAVLAPVARTESEDPVILEAAAARAVGAEPGSTVWILAPRAPTPVPGTERRSQEEEDRWRGSTAS